MDVEAHRDLRLLEAVHKDSRVTQRGLASKLGIALGLANIYLKRMVHKGFIKVVNVQPNRISYLVTPRGIAEKARLTYEFMDYSLHLYGEVRQHLRDGVAGLRGGRQARGDLRQRRGRRAGVPVAEGIGARTGGGVRQGQAATISSACRVLPIAEHAQVEFDLIIVATLDRSGQQAADLLAAGVPRDKLFPLRQEPAPDGARVETQDHGKITHGKREVKAQWH